MEGYSQRRNSTSKGTGLWVGILSLGTVSNVIWHSWSQDAWKKRWVGPDGPGGSTSCRQQGTPEQASREGAGSHIRLGLNSSQISAVTLWEMRWLGEDFWEVIAHMQMRAHEGLHLKWGLWGGGGAAYHRKAQEVTGFIRG